MALEEAAIRQRWTQQCIVQLERLSRIASRLHRQEVFDAACLFLADVVPLVSAALISEPEHARELVWPHQESEREREHESCPTVCLPLTEGDGETESLELELSPSTPWDLAAAESVSRLLSLALSRADSEDADAWRRGASSRRRMRPAILIVDDDDDTARALTYLLEAEGHRVERAANGVEALAAMRTELPAIVLLDVVMPLMDGYELRRRLLEDPALRRVPVVVVSGLAETSFDRDVVVLRKPFDLDRLLSVVERALEPKVDYFDAGALLPNGIVTHAVVPLPRPDSMVKRPPR